MSDEKWSEIRADYESGASLRTLAAKYNVSKSMIGERKHKEQWTELKSERTPLNNEGIIHRDGNAASRVAMAVRLPSKKLTFDQIAKECGYASPGACRNPIQRELQRTITTSVEELRREELLILNILHGEMWDMALDKGNLYRTFAVDRVLAISESRRKLMGLDIKPDDAIAANMVVVREVPNGYLGQTIEAKNG